MRQDKTNDGSYTVNDLKGKFNAAAEGLKSQMRLIDDMILELPEESKEWKDKFLQIRKELNVATNAGNESGQWDVIQKVIQLTKDYGQSISKG